MPRLSFLDPLMTAPRWQRLALAGVALAALGAGGYLLLVAPIATRVTTLRAERDRQQQELVGLRAMAAELTRTGREAAEVERRLEEAKDKLPTQREIPALYRTLSDAAVQSGLAVALFQPQGQRVRDYYNEIPISLVAEGGYHDVGDFIGRVATLPRAAMISELKLTGAVADTQSAGAGAARTVRPPDAGKPRRPVRAEIMLLTYVYRPVGSPPAPKPPGGAARAEAPKP
jgi:type IV pilus assembly protein PilO